MKKPKKVVISVKVTESLRDRIDELAAKGLTTRNNWLNRTLERVTKPKTKNNDLPW